MNTWKKKQQQNSGWNCQLKFAFVLFGVHTLIPMNPVHSWMNRTYYASHISTKISRDLLNCEKKNPKHQNEHINTKLVFFFAYILRYECDEHCISIFERTYSFFQILFLLLYCSCTNKELNFVCSYLGSFIVIPFFFCLFSHKSHPEHLMIFQIKKNQ